MAIKMRGLVWFFGEHHSGKTVAALTASDNPKKIAMLDGDSGKSAELASDLGIKHYVNLSEKGLDLIDLEFHKMFLKEIDDIPKNMELIVVDEPWRMLKSAHVYVDTNSGKFRKQYAPMGKIRGPQIWQDVRHVHLPNVYSRLLLKAPLVIFTSHEKKQVDDAGVRTGAMTPDADVSLMTSSGFVIRLTKNLRIPSFAPVGLVIKQPKPVINIKTGSVSPTFPLRIEPFTWETVGAYVVNPYNPDKPEKYETPSDRELSLITGALTKEQQAVYDLNRAMVTLQIEETMAEDVIRISANITAPSDAIRANKVVELLSETYPTIDSNTVLGILNTAKDIPIE